MSDLFKTFKHNGLTISLASDRHLPPDATDTDIRQQIRRSELRGDIVMVLGDMIDNPGFNVAGRVTFFHKEVARRLRRDQTGICVLGNHCLRTLGPSPEVWDLFDTPDEFTCPKADTPEVVEVQGRQIVAANIFYQFLVDPALLGITKESCNEWYRKSTDKFLFHGDLEQDTPFFNRLAGAAVQAISEQTAILCTHCVVHPHQVQFKVANIGQHQKELQKRFQARLLCNPEEDIRSSESTNKKAKQPGFEFLAHSGADEYRRVFNTNVVSKNGSPVLLHPSVQHGDLLVCSGHTHDPLNTDLQAPGGKLSFRSHQPVIWKNNGS